MAEEKKVAKPGIKSSELWFNFAAAAIALIVGVLAGFGVFDPEAGIGAIIVSVVVQLQAGAYTFGRSMVKKKELEK